MSKKVSLGVAATVTLIAMAVTFSMTMTVSMNMFNNTVSSVKNKERMYNKLSEVDRYVRANEYFDINDDTLNDTIASGYMPVSYTHLVCFAAGTFISASLVWIE